MAEEPAKKPSTIGIYNLVVGTQTFGAAYQFTKETKLVETAQAVLDMGSNILKFGVGREQYYEHNHGDTFRNIPTANANVHSLTELFRLEPSHKRVLDMPFAYYVIWTYPFAGCVTAHLGNPFARPMTTEQAKGEYDELRNLASYLLQSYSGSGKTFYLGHWEGDWLILGKFDWNLDPTDDQINNMATWLNVRQKAIDDARNHTPHNNVQVYHYAEVNLVQKAMQGRKSVTSHVLPLTNVDFVSYSSYDTTLLPSGKIAINLSRSLDYIQSKLPPKPKITERRVFIGEYGFPTQSFSPAKQDDHARQVMRTGLAWGCPFVLYWEMFNNEVRDGKHLGFWMIDDKNAKQPVYHTHRQFYEQARRYVTAFETVHSRAPTRDEFIRQAVGWLPLSETN